VYIIQTQHFAKALCVLCVFVGLFAGKPADYLFLVIFNWLALIVVCLFLGFPLLFDPMVMSILYIWCQLNRDNIVSFWFGTQFKVHRYYPSIVVYSTFSFVFILV